MIALIEESASQFSINNRENRHIADVAEMYGCHTYTFSANLEEGEALADALMYVPKYAEPTPAIWVGFIPTFKTYDELYKVAASRNIFLLNTPSEHQLAQEFDQYYPLLSDLTPKSTIVTQIKDCHTAVSELDFPLFVRGAVKSNKYQGWQACVAYDEAQLENLVEQVLLHSSRARGRVIVRQLAKLRHKSKMPGDFPRGREYRVFLHKQEVLAFGYYWDEFEDEFDLTQEDISAIKHIACKAAKRVNTPFIMADVGQLETSDWTIIEIGDAQFAGLSNVSVLELWSKLATIS